MSRSTPMCHIEPHSWRPSTPKCDGAEKSPFSNDIAVFDNVTIAPVDDREFTRQDFLPVTAKDISGRMILAAKRDEDHAVLCTIENAANVPAAYKAYKDAASFSKMTQLTGVLGGGDLFACYDYQKKLDRDCFAKPSHGSFIMFDDPAIGELPVAPRDVTSRVSRAWHGPLGIFGGFYTPKICENA